MTTATAFARPSIRRNRYAVQFAALILLLGAIIPLIAGSIPARAAVAFSTRFSTTESGDIAIVANTLLSCSPTGTNGASCSDARNGVGTYLENGQFTMINVDVDDDPSTFNSSTATFNLPTDGEVLWAGLYWGAVSTNTERTKIRFATPASGGYVSVSGALISTNSTAGTANDIYHAFADVTPLVQSAGSGSYAAANVQTKTDNTNLWAGWAMVVVYRDPAAPLRRLDVIDGLGHLVNYTDKRLLTLPITGFTTPASGPVKARLGVVAYDGDAIQKDSFKFGNTSTSLTALTDATNPATDFFNSSITRLGARIPKSPDFVNQLGYDADVVDASNILPNGATEAVITIGTSADAYYPGVVTAAIDVADPASITPTATTAPTDTPTETTIPAAMATPEPTATATPEPTATLVPTATATPEPTIEPTATTMPTATTTPEPTVIPTETPTATLTPEPTATLEPTAILESITKPEPTPTTMPDATTISDPTAAPAPTAAPVDEPPELSLDPPAATSTPQRLEPTPIKPVVYRVFIPSLAR